MVLTLARTGATLAADAPRVLEVFINDKPRNLVMDIVDRDGKLFASIEDLDTLGFAVQKQAGQPPDTLIPLSEIPGLAWTVDERKQEIHFTAAPEAFRSQTIGPAGDVSRTPPRASYGALLNYDVFGTTVAGQTEGSGVFEARGFAPWGVLTTSWMATVGGSAVTGSIAPPLDRLDTNFTYADPDSLRQYEAGDTIAGSLAWTRAYRLGGLQMASNFAVRPDLVTFPVPDLGGRTNVPSTVDLFVNGVRQLSQDVDPGPFQLRQPPIMTGADDISVVVRDAAGRETVQNVSFYTSANLLRPGLASYSVETGWVRANYGLAGDHYAELAGSGTVRYGLTDKLTGEAHLEATGRTAMAGLGTAIDLGGFAVGTASVAASTPVASVPGAGRPSGPPLLYSVGIERDGRVFSFAASTTRATSAFQDVATDGGTPVPARVSSASVGVTLPRVGGLRVAYAEISGRGTQEQLLDSVTPNVTQTNAKVISATYSVPLLDRLQLYATFYRDFESSGSTGASLGLVLPIGQRTTLSTEGDYNTGQEGGSVTASQAAIDPGDFGWQARITEGVNEEETGQASYIAPWATMAATVDRVAGETGFRGELTGALVAMPHEGVFAGTKIDDSFAVVETGGLANVTVMRENRPIGQTDSDGVLFVPRLESWVDNRLSISPDDLPADVEVGDLKQLIRPRDRSGVVVAFDVKRSRSAVLHLVDETGKPIPVGSVAHLAPDGKPVPVGYDGEIFIENLTDNNILAVATANGDCTAHFAFKPVADTLPDLGQVACKAAAP